MNTLRGILQRFSGRQPMSLAGGFEPQLLHRLYQRLALAIVDGGIAELELLLASDSEWRRLRGGPVVGRAQVIASLLHERDVPAHQIGAIDVHLHGALGVAQALWDDHQNTWIRSCIFAMRRGYWQAVSVRDRAFAAADLPAPRSVPLT